MELTKIQFEDGQKVSDAYVEINGVKHPVVKAQYQGKTPLSARNLNKMQENMETAISDLDERVVSYRNVLVDEQALIKECGGLKLKKLNKLEGKTEQEVRSGKNLLNFIADKVTQTGATSNITYGNDGWVTIENSTTNNSYVNIIVPTKHILSGKTYSLRIEFADNNKCNVFLQKTFDDYSKSTGNNGVITNTAVSDYMRVLINLTTTMTIKIRLTLVEGTYTADTMPLYEQYGASPTPNFPSEVKTVTGNVEVDVRNKNLFDKESVLKGYELQGSTGNTVANANWYVSDFIKIDSLSSYYLSGNKTAGASICFYDKEKKYIRFQGETITGIIAYVENAEYIRFNGLLSELNNNIQIEEGTKATEYVEYKGGNYPLWLGNVSKDLMKDATITKGYINSSNEIISATNWSYTGYIDISDRNYDYNYISFGTGNSPRTILYNADKSVKEVLNVTPQTIDLSTKNASYIRISYANDTTAPKLLKLKKNSSTLKDIELCKIGDYTDYIYRNGSKWFKRSYVGKYIFTGNENFELQDNTSYSTNILRFNTYASLLSNKKLNSGDYYEDNLFCNIFECLALNYTSRETESIAGHTNSTRISIFIDKSRLSSEDITGLQTYLKALYEAGTPVIIYYVLATPTDTEITDTTLIEQLNALENAQLYEGITNITITGDNLTPIVDLDYWTWFKGESGESGNVYSTEEQVIGTWIDGKPLYRKVIETTTPETTENTRLIQSLPNIDTFVDIRGRIYADSVWGINDYLSDSFKSVCYYNKNETSIRMAVGSSLLSKPVKITVEYTKTTDV